MHSLAPETDVRAMHVVVEDARLVVDLMDGGYKKDTHFN